MMNLTCDLCGGPLESIPDEGGAVCSVCGLFYAEDRLQEKRREMSAPVAKDTRIPLANAFDFPGTDQEYFSELLRREFSQYALRENVRHRELTIPISCVLCRGDSPVAAIFLVGRSDTNAQYQVNKASQILTPLGVPCLSFVTGCRNDASYVIQRVRGVLPKM